MSYVPLLVFYWGILLISARQFSSLYPVAFFIVGVDLFLFLLM